MDTIPVWGWVIISVVVGATVIYAGFALLIWALDNDGSDEEEC